MKLVYVEWEDCFSYESGWMDLGIMRGAPPAVCKSVGWLVDDGKYRKVIVSHLMPEGETGCGDVTIPNGCIIRMVVLKEPRTKKI